MIKTAFKIRFRKTDPFVHVLKNIYAVPTPCESDDVSSRIEDFFGEATKATVIDGKTFSANKTIDKDKEYGKQVFAHKVVRPRADTIDFTGFRPLLTNIVAVIKRHKAAVTSPAGEP